VESDTIYWSNLSQIPSIDFTLKPLIIDIAKSQNLYPRQNHVACPAIRDRHLNTYFSTIPYDLEVNVSNNEFTTNSPDVMPRQGLYKNSYAFDWKIQRIFFSPFNQTMQVSPAFLHKTSYSQYGHAPSGEFNINKWFRPSSPTFQLWENETTFKAKKGEAHLYFNFPNNNKLILKEFNMSERLFQIMVSCVNYKFQKSNLPLFLNYQMFEQTGLQKETLKEIKNNLIN
jgi:hypothetical protein